MIKFEVDKTKCVGCGACVDACPTGSIKMGEDDKSSIDQATCQHCGACKDICSFEAITGEIEE